ncbi:MAG: phosphoadenosine phosphosulfate reductase, partial [Oscillospiraceae bacterium]
PVNGTKNGFHYGYSWCGGRCRWGTREKVKMLDTYAKSKNAIVCVGIAYDEQNRLKRLPDWKHSTIADYKMTEADCLQYCYGNGWNWLEGNVELYSILDRVSCWCCANKNLKELKNIYLYLPEYWDKLKVMQSKLSRPMKGFYKGKPVGIFELEERFKKEMEIRATDS